MMPACYRLGRRFSFSAAHRLPNVPDGHPCGRLHGHTYRFDLEVTGPLSEPSGWVMDLDILDGVVREIIGRLDHQFLNETLDNPTVENLCRWAWPQFAVALELHGVALRSVAFAEDDSTWCVLEGP